jgi:limonene-1,2-epoxide hydrolase
MQENDWHRAAAHFTEDCEIDWPCSGERIVGRENFAAIQSRYPTNTGRWSFDVHRIVAEEDIVVSEVTVTDGEQAARVVAFSILEGSQIAHQIEYWPMAYDPQPGREGLTQPIARVP